MASSSFLLNPTRFASLRVRLLVAKRADSGHSDRAGEVVSGHRPGQLHILQIGVLDRMAHALQHGQEVRLLGHGVRDLSLESGRGGGCRPSRGSRRSSVRRQVPRDPGVRRQWSLRARRGVTGLVDRRIA